MAIFRLVLAATAITFSGIAAANNTDDGFIWIDANTRIKVKPVAVKPAPDAAAGATAPQTAPKKDEKKATPKK